MFPFEKEVRTPATPNGGKRASGNGVRRHQQPPVSRHVLQKFGESLGKSNFRPIKTGRKVWRRGESKRIHELVPCRTDSDNSGQTHSHPGHGRGVTEGPMCKQRQFRSDPRQLRTLQHPRIIPTGSGAMGQVIGTTQVRALSTAADTATRTTEAEYLCNLQARSITYHHYWWYDHKCWC